VPSLFSVSARAVDREAEWFSVYDAAGELVSICLGSRIGFGLPAGAYYVRSRLGVEAARILKLR
jgi:hypothetical protein